MTSVRADRRSPHPSVQRHGASPCCLVALVVALVVALAGCDDDADPPSGQRDSTLTPPNTPEAHDVGGEDAPTDSADEDDMPPVDRDVPPADDADPPTDDALMAEPPCLWHLPTPGQEPRGDYEGVDIPWRAPPCWSTVRQVFDPAAISRVLFIGDGSLVRMPDGDRALQRLETIRGRLTRFLGTHLPGLEAPALVAGGADWYGTPQVPSVTHNHLPGFSVCAHVDAIWNDLVVAVDRSRNQVMDPDEAERGLTRRCIDKAMTLTADGTLLVIIAFAEYGPAQLARDLRALQINRLAGLPVTTLPEHVTQGLDQLREYLTEPIPLPPAAMPAPDPRPDPAAPPLDAVLLVGNLPAWRAGRSEGNPVCPAYEALDPPFITQLAAINTRLVADATAMDYDVVLLDEHIRWTGARCLDDGEPRGLDPPCGSAVGLADDGIEAPIAFQRLQKCCWTVEDPADETASCARPDADGHLGIALLFEASLRALTAP